MMKHRIGENSADRGLLLFFGANENALCAICEGVSVRPPWRNTMQQTTIREWLMILEIQALKAKNSVDLRQQILKTRRSSAMRWGVG